MITLQCKKPNLMCPIVFRRLPFQGLGMRQTKINRGVSGHFNYYCFWSRRALGLTDSVACIFQSYPCTFFDVTSVWRNSCRIADRNICPETTPLHSLSGNPQLTLLVCFVIVKNMQFYKSSFNNYNNSDIPDSPKFSQVMNLAFFVKTDRS